MLEQDWLKGEQLERRAVNYAIEKLVQRHLERIREPRDERLDKTERADQERLTREFYYWHGRAAQLRAQEEAGKHHARLNSSQAQQRADDLRERAGAGQKRNRPGTAD